MFYDYSNLLFTACSTVCVACSESSHVPRTGKFYILRKPDVHFHILENLHYFPFQTLREFSFSSLDLFCSRKSDLFMNFLAPTNCCESGG